MAAGAALALLSASAEAAPITRSYDFDFTFSSGPIAEIVGSFTATYDMMIGVGGTLDALSSNLPPDYLPAQFTSFGNRLFVGNDCTIFDCGLSTGSNEFEFNFYVDGNGFNPTDASAAYTTSSSTAVYGASSGTVTLSTVPLPPSAPMFGAGLLTLGVLGYGMKRRHAAA